jgi:hypothetical protein
MPYLVSSIIAVVAAMIILFTRYEADDSNITAELDRMKSMFLAVDGFVNTYVESGGSLTDVNFEELYKNSILLGNMKKTTPAAATDDVTGTGRASSLIFPKSDVRWQLIPVLSTDVKYSTSAGSAYKLLVDMTKNAGLKSRAAFAESFSGREFCEKILFGTFQTKGKTYDSTLNKEDFKEDGTNSDSLFVCVVFK